MNMEDPLERREPAGFWLRAGAMTIDGLVIVAMLYALSLFLGLFGAGVLMRAAGMLVPLCYHSLCLAVWEKTAGKCAAGVRVLRLDGQALSFPRALCRTLAYAASTMTLGAGFALAAFTPRKRALHDYLCGTAVVCEEETAPWRRFAVVLLGAASAAIFLLLRLAGGG